MKEYIKPNIKTLQSELQTILAGTGTIDKEGTKADFRTNTTGAASSARAKDFDYSDNLWDDTDDEE